MEKKVKRLRDVVLRVPGYKSQSSRFDSRRYQTFWELVGLERAPLSLVSTIEELLERKGSGFCLESQEYGHGDLPQWPRGTPLSAKVSINFPTSDGLSVGIVGSRTKATELFS
jgi:hypothetical protein